MGPCDPIIDRNLMQIDILQLLFCILLGGKINMWEEAEFRNAEIDYELLMIKCEGRR